MSSVKRVPVEELSKAISYNPYLHVYERNPTQTKLINPISKNKQDEFLWILEKQTGSIFHEDDWEEQITCQDREGLCICSKNIENIYTIKHKPTSQSFVVGSECIKKISKNLHNKIFKEKCVVCDDPILDKRTILGKKNICSYECDNSILHFGKYKNIPIKKVPVSYLEWLCKQDWCRKNVKDRITEVLF